MSNSTQPSGNEPKPTPPAFPGPLRSSDGIRRVTQDSSSSSTPAGFPKAHPSPAPQYTYQNDNTPVAQTPPDSVTQLQGESPRKKLWISVAALFALLLIIAVAVIIPIAIKMFSPEEKSALDAATVSILRIDASDGGSVEISALAKNPFKYKDMNLGKETIKFAVSEDFRVDQGMCSSSSSVAVDLPGDGAEDVRNQYVNIILGDGVTDVENPSALPSSQVYLYDLEGNKIPTTLYSHAVNVGNGQLPATTFIAQSSNYENRLASVSVTCSSVDTLETFVSDVVNGKSPYKLLVTVK